MPYYLWGSSDFGRTKEEIIAICDLSASIYDIRNAKADS